MNEYVIYRLDTGERLFVRNGEVQRVSDFIGSVHQVNQELDDVSKHLDEIVKEVKDITSDISSVSFNNIYDIYEYFERLYYQSRVESIKKMSKAMMQLIEEVARIMNVEIFSYDKKVLFISNLAEVLSRIGYELHVVDFDYTLPIVFEVRNKKTGETEFFKIDSTSFIKVLDNKLLKELIRENSVIRYTSDNIRYEILRLIRKYFKM